MEKKIRRWKDRKPVKLTIDTEYKHSIFLI